MEHKRASRSSAHRRYIAGAAAVLLAVAAVGFLFSARNGPDLMTAGPSATRTAALTSNSSANPTPPSTAAAASMQSSQIVSTTSLALGDTWVYQVAYYEGSNATDVVTTTSIITERVVEIQTVPDYFAARIQQEYSPETSSEYWRVVLGDRIYRQEGDLDVSTVRKQGEVELVFPLELGARWYQGEEIEKLYPAHDNSSMLWRVTKVGSMTVPAGSFDNCYLLEEEIGGMTFENWFCPGVGWVDMKADHGGTPFGSRWVLVQYSIKTASAGMPRETLDRFMQVRIDRQNQLALELLTDDFVARTNARWADVDLFQVSNPCWYRYRVVRFEQTTPTRVQARVRVYEHFWGGDVTAGPPQSWEQVIGLVETSAGWRVDDLAPPDDRRSEPSEPHGPTLSACNTAH